MAETAAAPEGAAVGGAAEGEVSLAEIKRDFERAVMAPDDEPADEKPAEKKTGKPAPSKKGEKPAEDAEAKPPADDDEPEPEPTKADHARFRAERRKLRAAQEELAKEREEAAQLHARERQLWGEVHRAHREGRPIDVLRMLGLDPEQVAKQLAESALGNDPAVAAMQRKLAELERERELERQERERGETSAKVQQQQRQWESTIATVLQEAEDPVLQRMAEEPELLAEIRKQQEEWFVAGEIDQRTARDPRTMRRAAREVAKRLESAKTRLGRIFRETEDAAPASDAGKTSSAAGRASSPRQPDKRSTRTMPASQGAAVPRELSEIDTSTQAGRSALKRWFESEIRRSQD